jgi:branched-subunit amino acid transport protein
MSSVDIWIVIALLTLATVLARCLLFVFASHLKLPPRMQYALRYAPAAAMAAIVAPDLFLSDGVLSLDWHNPKLLAGIGALLFFAVSRHMLGTIVVGMSIFTALRLLI